ncbi:hypothetical protein [Bartonella henselae]|uniref:hypothetical protein n=1 Tax=Bartonella henselae TaxID=38323 RepID=UPI0003DF9B8A|nr:hypothetical protein [Bartonella henselae]ETS07645.1 hypothetical protein Q653_01299 [Bartonella henselae JK 42]ETS16448.1 hypothetical protein Q652_00133 [Bartonella henselae JK 41]KEC57691.1 hypothetical protein O97_00726 [Bartonella henselae str. Zeus]KEC62987.1 hypothetical protein O95_00596 [Bartonella henselae JK 53]MDM9984013.1 hypothetical protein [Bartonella henselae]
MNKEAHKNGDGKTRIEFIPPLALIRNGGRGGHDASGNWSSRGSWGAVVVIGGTSVYGGGGGGGFGGSGNDGKNGRAVNGTGGRGGNSILAVAVEEVATIVEWVKARGEIVCGVAKVVIVVTAVAVDISLVKMQQPHQAAMAVTEQYL